MPHLPCFEHRPPLVTALASLGTVHLPLQSKYHLLDQAFLALLETQKALFVARFRCTAQRIFELNT